MYILFIIPFGSLIQSLLLYFFELLALIYLWKKYSYSKFYLLIILFFFTAIFSFAGKNFQDVYRIVLLVFTLWISNKNKVFASFKKGDGIITFSFVLFSIMYFYSSFLNNDTITIILSQYSRYIITFCLWFIVRTELYTNYQNTEKLNGLVYELFLIQIFISVVKLIIFQGKQMEYYIGTISNVGGGDGTIIPIFGFIMLWFYKGGVFERKDWLYTAGLMLVGFLAGKRAVWFIVPIVVAAFMIYVPKLKMNKSLWFGIIMAPLAFYMGVRLTPTLNPENKIWGSFDYDYAFGYAGQYQFGDKTNKFEKRAQGRGGATMLLWDKWNSDESLSSQDWNGIGLSKFYSTKYEDFDKLNTGINTKGAATGLFQTYVTTGYAGIFTTAFFFITLIWKIKTRRIRWVILAIVLWEYLMYIGNIFRTPAYMFMIIYFLHYSNSILKRSPKGKSTGLFNPKENLMI